MYRRADRGAFLWYLPGFVRETVRHAVWTRLLPKLSAPGAVSQAGVPSVPITSAAAKRMDATCQHGIVEHNPAALPAPCGTSTATNAHTAAPQPRCGSNPAARRWHEWQRR